MSQRGRYILVRVTSAKAGRERDKDWRLHDEGRQAFGDQPLPPGQASLSQASKLMKLGFATKNTIHGLVLVEKSDYFTSSILLAG